MTRSVPFFLPVSEAAVSHFITEKAVPESPLGRAALFTAYFIAEKPLNHADVGRLLASAQQLFSKDAAQSLPHLLERHAQAIKLGPHGLSAALTKQDVYFAPATLLHALGEEAELPYTDALQSKLRGAPQDYEVTFHPVGREQEADADEDLDGEPPPEPSRLLLSGNRDQAVVANVIASAPGELIWVDGYAGTGKTHLVAALSEALGSAITYIAPRYAQLHGMRRRVGGSMKTVPLAWFANRLAEYWEQVTGAWAPRYTSADSISSYHLGAQAQLAGIHPIGKRSAPEVLAILYKGLSAWCRTDALGLDAKHFRRALPANEDPWPYVALGLQLWKAMFTRPANGEPVFAISLLYLGKWLALNLDAIPAKYGTLVVDEAHDLPPSWLYLFSKYLGGCVLMGDPYQKLEGRAWDVPGAMKCSMAHSFRTGLQGGKVIDKTLGWAPKQLVNFPFCAGRGHITRLRHEDSPTRLQQDGLRIYGSEWALLEDAIHIKESGGAFMLSKASKGALQAVVRNAVRLYFGGIATNSWWVSGCTTKNGLVELLEREGRARILALLESGRHALTDTWHALERHPGRGRCTITLTLIDHAKNLEESVVMLNECCFTREGLWRGYSAVHAAYLGMTRARDELWIPGDAVDRLGEISREQAAAQTAVRPGWRRRRR